MKTHSWFKDVQWSKLKDKKMVPPFIPNQNEDNFDLKHVNNNDWKDADVVKDN